MSIAPYIIGLGGALRAGSSTEKALRYALAAAERAGARTALFTGPQLDLPLFAADSGDRPAAAMSLLAELAQADGVILASPGYHGSLSGAVKNALDYVELLRGDGRPYFSGRAVGCIATAGGWTGAVHALSALRDIVHALRGWPTPMAAVINTSQKVFDQDGACLDPRVAETLQIVAGEVMQFARMTKAAAVSASVVA